MPWNSLDTGLHLSFSREVDGRAGEDWVEKQNAEMGLMPVVAADRHPRTRSPERADLDVAVRYPIAVVLQRDVSRGRSTELPDTRPDRHP